MSRRGAECVHVAPGFRRNPGRPARCRFRRGIEFRVKPGVLQSGVPSAVAGRNVLGPVARDRQAERQQAGEGDALRKERRRILRPVGGRRDVETPARRALQKAAPPQPRPIQGPRADDRHDDVQRLSGAEREPVGGVVAEQVDEEARERVPEDEAGGDRSRRPVHLSHVQQVCHQQQVLGPVVEHHGMPETLRVGKLHCPPDLGHCADDLTVDEVADASHAHQERGRYDQGVRDEQERLAVAFREQRGAESSAEQQAVRRHAAEPPRRNQMQVLTVEGPFVEGNLERASADQHAHGDEQAQAPHLAR